MSMNITVAYNETIDEQYSHSRVIVKKYFVDMETSNGTKIHHFRKLSILTEGYCYYHFLVDVSSRKVVGWGFDSDLGNPNKCGNSG